MYREGVQKTKTVEKIKKDRKGELGLLQKRNGLKEIIWIV